jgi:hypothetical protein
LWIIIKEERTVKELLKTIVSITVSFHINCGIALNCERVVTVTNAYGPSCPYLLSFVEKSHEQ